MHPQKFTVLCGFWAGGIIGPYFIENDVGEAITVNGERYRTMITNLFWPKLSDMDVDDMWFQQDGATCHTANATMDILHERFEGKDDTGMVVSTVLLLVLSLFDGSFSEDNEVRKWPNGLQRCSLSNENLDDCILKAAKQVMPLLIKGNKELGLVSLDPMAMGNFTLGAERGPITLTVDLASAQLVGQSAMKLESVRYDRENFKMEMEGLHKEIELTGDYKTQGKLFRVPINSKGTLLFTLKNMQATHTVHFKPRKQRGLTFMDLEIILKINHVDNFKMDLYNPSTTRLAGLALNKLLNDNWRAIFAAFTPSMEDVVQRVYTDAFKPMFQNIPYEEILPAYEIDQSSSSTDKTEEKSD